MRKCFKKLVFGYAVWYNEYIQKIQICFSLFTEKTQIYVIICVMKGCVVVKKILYISIFTIVLLASFLLSGFAQNDATWKENTGEIDLTLKTATGTGSVWDGNVLYITAGGDFTVTGTLTDGGICVETDDKVKLRLSGASITNTNGPAIYFKKTEKSFITITEDTENYLADGAFYTEETADAPLFSADDLEIKGSGTLTICGNFKHGIAGSDDITIENGNLVINAYEHGIKAGGTITVRGGNLDVTAKTGKGMKAEQAFVIEGGTTTVVSEQSEGLESKGPLTIGGGDIFVTAKDDGLNTGAENNMDRGFGGHMPMMRDGENGASRFVGRMPENGMPPTPPEGEMPRGGRWMEGEAPPMPPEGEMPMMQGVPPMEAQDGIDHTIMIAGGNIYIHAEGDGIDSNGALVISGGNIVINGPQNNGNGALDAQTGITVQGGRISILSSSGMLQLPNEKPVIYVQISNGKAGDEIVLKDSEGKTVASHTAVKAYQAFVYMDDTLDGSLMYTVYKNGELYTTTTLTENAGRGIFGGMSGMDGREMKDRTFKNREREISVFLDGKKISFATAPFIKNDTTLVGFRAILELLGAEVSWNEQTREVTAKKDGIHIVLTIDSKKAYVNGEEHILLVAPEIVNGSTMIPVRFVSEQLGLSVAWNAPLRRVEITTN